MALQFKKQHCQVSSFFCSRTLSESSPSSPILPFDIWREIVEQLSLPTLLSICLVNKHFLMLTQPLVFEHLVIRPSGHQLKTLARNFRHSLQFLLRSPRIAGAVHHFHIDLSAFPHTKTVQSASDIILKEFADSASAFPNLRRLTFVSVYINLPVLVKLQRLAPFTLSLKSCIFTSELTKTNLDIPISNLQFRDSSPFMEYATPRRRYPELFLRTEHLKTIIAGREYAETALIEMADYTRTFTRLTHLEFPIESTSSNHLIPVLSLCPNLETLNLNGRITSPPPHGITDYNTPFPPTFLPNLKSFSGPLLFARRLFLSNQLLPSHTVKRKLHFITICLSRSFSLHADTKIDLNGCTKGETIFDTISLLPDTTTTLNFPALFLFGPEGLLPQIKRATALKHLGINSDPRYYYARPFQPSQFIKHLINFHHHFPNTLETLTIGIQIKNPFNCKRSSRVGGGKKKESKIKQEAEILSQTSFEMIPSLKTLKVWYWAKPAPRWVTWVKQASGKVDAFWEYP